MVQDVGGLLWLKYPCPGEEVRCKKFGGPESSSSWLLGFVWSAVHSPSRTWPSTGNFRQTSLGGVQRRSSCFNSTQMLCTL